MNKKLFLFFILLLLVVPNSFAFFTKSHLFWSSKGFYEVDSSITQLCRPYLNIVLDGNTATDVPVLHYWDNEVTSYISTHTRGSGYDACMREAGTDVEMQCFCVGMGLHIVQDSFAHNPDGLVPTYLSKNFASNFFGHMVIEKSFENKHLEHVSKEIQVTDGSLDYYNSIVLNSLFEETGGSGKYFELIKQMSNLDIKADAQIFRSGYLGEGFYNTVYKDKLDFMRITPTWFVAVIVSTIIFGFGLAFIFLKFGKTKWKWGLALEWGIFGIIGIVIISSVFMGTTWKITTKVIEIPPSLGLMKVSDSSLESYDKAVQDATNLFLKTGQIPYDDVSGLTYYDKEGKLVKGALAESEKPFKFLLLPTIIILIGLLNLWLIKKTFRRKKLLF